jgi:DNA-binding CsgD family transcriptional regulator/tetratricopeptide (TPR) repeat protein
MLLVERNSSLATLFECAADARRGRGRMVLIGGEAGVGKSALVEACRREVSDARWSWGVCDGLFTPRPLGPLFDIADQLGGGLLDLCRANADRHELFRALLDQVRGLGPLDAVAVEDVHWADEATLDLLGYLGRRLQDCALLLIVTYRNDGLAADDLLRIALGQLVTQPSTRQIELEPLSPEGVELLAHGSGLDPSALYSLTRGNPFYVTEVLQAGMQAVPASARDAVLSRAARLSTEARAVLDAAAVIGTRVEPSLLETITGCPPHAIDELVVRGLLVSEGRWLTFRHEIARLAVEQAIAAHRNSVIHRRVLDALQSLGGCADDARMAFHAEAAGDARAVLRYAPPAARRAAALASHREAVAQCQRALRFADAAEPALAAELYDRLANELSLLDRFQDAADACEHALALWRREGNQLREGDTLRRLSHVWSNLCLDANAQTTIDAAMSILEPLGPTVELASAYATAANRLMLRAEYKTSSELALRAQAIAEPLGAVDVLSDALNSQAVCTFSDGGNWTAQMGRALEIALSGHCQEQAARAYHNLCAGHNANHNFPEAERYGTAGIAYCDEHDITAYSRSLRSELGNTWLDTGRWNQAMALSLEVLSTSGSSPGNRVRVLRKVGVIWARRDEPEAWESLNESIEYAEASGDPQNILRIRLARAEAHWLKGKLDEAIREVERADDVSVSAWDRGAVGVWLRRTGSTRSPRDDLAEPYRLELDGNWRKAADAWTKLGCPYEAAMALASAPDEAALRKALDILSTLGASATARVVRHRLRQLGVRSVPVGPRATTKANPFGLSRREREVLGLICAALSNAEIAATLHISSRTVDHHVSAILTKLGAPNRMAAARTATTLGLTRDAGSTQTHGPGKVVR